MNFWIKNKLKCFNKNMYIIFINQLVFSFLSFVLIVNFIFVVFICFLLTQHFVFFCPFSPTLSGFRIDFIDSKKNGGKLLVINGFRFFRNKKHGSRQYWKCSNYYKEKCPAIAIYDEITLNLRLCHQHRHVSSNDIEIKPFMAKEHNMMGEAALVAFKHWPFYYT